MNNPGSVGTQPAVTSSPTISGKGASKSFSGNFPSEVLLGEIKPLKASKIGAGIFQLDSYERGYKAFVSQVNKVSGSTNASIGVGRLNLSIPDRLNFDLWASQHTTPSNDTTFGGQRLWVAALGNGVYAYFAIASSYSGPPPWYNDQTQMRDLRAKSDRTRTRGISSTHCRKFLPADPRSRRAAA